MDAELLLKIKSLRKLEREAKLLLRKMDRIESEWNSLKEEIVKKGKEMPQTLGDVLAYRQKKNI